jgi:heme oxygenase
LKPLLDKNILQSLKEETNLLHDIVDKSSGADKIISHSITKNEFANLLTKNYLAYSTIDANIDNFGQEDLVKPIYFLPRISNWVAKDLQKISSSLPIINTSFFLNNKFEALGAIYVTEGSLLGGLFIGKHLTECNNLKNSIQSEFYTTDKSRLNRWKIFKNYLNEKKFTDSEIRKIIDGAKKSFSFFIKTFEKPT